MGTPTLSLRCSGVGPAWGEEAGATEGDHRAKEGVRTKAPGTCRGPGWAGGLGAWGSWPGQGMGQCIFVSVVLSGGTSAKGLSSFSAVQVY